MLFSRPSAVAAVRANSGPEKLWFAPSMRIFKWSCPHYACRVNLEGTWQLIERHLIKVHRMYLPALQHVWRRTRYDPVLIQRQMYEQEAYGVPYGTERVPDDAWDADDEWSDAEPDGDLRRKSLEEDAGISGEERDNLTDDEDDDDDEDPAISEGFAVAGTRDGGDDGDDEYNKDDSDDEETEDEDEDEESEEDETESDSDDYDSDDSAYFEDTDYNSEDDSDDSDDFPVGPRGFVSPSDPIILRISAARPVYGAVGCEREVLREVPPNWIQQQFMDTPIWPSWGRLLTFPTVPEPHTIPIERGLDSSSPDFQTHDNLLGWGY